MRFSYTWWPQKNDVAGFVNKPERAQFLNLPFVDGRLKAEVKLIEVLQKRQVRQLQPGAQIPAASRVDFAAQQFVQKIRIAQLFLGSLLQQPLQPCFHCFRPSPLRAVCNRSIGVIAHLPSPRSHKPPVGGSPPPAQWPGCGPESCVPAVRPAESRDDVRAASPPNAYAGPGRELRSDRGR